MDTRLIDIMRSANVVGRELLALKSGENLAIVCDNHSTMEMVYALAGVALSVGAEYTILHQPSRQPARKNELNPIVEAGLERADAMVGITGSGGGPSYSPVVKRLLNEKRLRIISMVMRDVEIFTSGGALADYKTLYDDGKRLASIWEKGEIMHITSPAGTDITAPIARDNVIVECGYAHKPGMAAAFSDGEVSSRPIEGTAHGVIVIDGPSAIVGKPSGTIRIEVRDGKAVSVEGDCPQAEQLRHIVETVRNADNIAEFGIGLNPDCRRNGRFEEEKKARGLVHIALGDNIFYGGTTESAVHIDMVIYAPTVYLDDRVIVDNGTLGFAVA